MNSEQRVWQRTTMQVMTKLRYSFFATIMRLVIFAPDPSTCMAFSTRAPLSLSSSRCIHGGGAVVRTRKFLQHQSNGGRFVLAIPSAESSLLHLSKITSENNVVEDESTIISSQIKSTTENETTLAGCDGNGSDDDIIMELQIEDTINNGNAERTMGILVLLTVPLAWGTYTPVVKYMYEKMDPSMPGFVFSAGYYAVAAISLSLLTRLQQQQQQDSADGAVVEYNGAVNTRDNGDNRKVEGDEDASILGGWELGSYLFVGNGLQVIGLQTVPADRAAFLVQLTTVLVPLFSALSDGRLSAIPLRTWFACIIAFGGVIIMGADGKEMTDGVVSTAEGADINQFMSSLQLSQGDILIVLAAFAYTMHVVRLGAYAPKTAPLNLAASKASTEAFLSVLLVLGLTMIGSIHIPLPEFVSKTGYEVREYFIAVTSAFMDGTFNEKKTSVGVSIVAILWTGWVTCAYTIYAQSFGQRRVNPTDSNLIYTTQPLFSSVFAFVLLGETLGFYGYIGATLIGAALLLVTTSSDHEP